VHAVPACSFHARPRALAQAATFLLGDPAEDRDQQGSDGAPSVEPRLAHAHDLDPSAVEVEHGLHVAHHGPAEPIERPHQEHVEHPPMGVAHHAHVLGSRLRGAGLLLIGGDELVPARTGEPLHIGALVLVGLLLRADSQVDRGATLPRHVSRTASSARGRCTSSRTFSS
jgi:hypothetical protein